MEYIYYIGETAAAKTRHSQPKRCFPFTVLVYVIQGMYFCTVEAETVAVREGQLLVVPPFVYHDVCMTADGVLDWAHIAAFSQGSEMLTHYRVPRVISGEAAKRLRKAVIAANESAKAEGLQRALLCDAAVATAYAELLTLSVPLCVGRKADATVEQVAAQVTERPERPFTLEEMAACAGLSVSAFSARFRTRYGMAPQRYFLEWRIKQSTYLLLRGAGVAETAARLGFYDAYHFSRTFRRHIGCSPTEYVRTHTIEV